MIIYRPLYVISKVGLGVCLLLVVTCLMYKKPPSHPLAESAILAAESAGIRVDNVDYYAMPCLKSYAIFRVFLRVQTTDPHHPTHHYIAVSEYKKPILLHNVLDLNKLLAVDDIRIDSDSTTWLVARLLFNINNLSRALSKKYIITTIDFIPGHFEKLKRENTNVSAELRNRAKISFFQNMGDKWVCINNDAYEFILKMIDVHDKIYLGKTVNLDDIIKYPLVECRDDNHMGTFYTWELAEGAIKKWQVNMNTDNYITYYSYTTKALYVGDWSAVGTMHHDYFNYQWSKHSKKNH